MTLEKAIEFGKIFLKSIENEKGSATYEFVETAVKMMEKESCEDSISRQAVEKITWEEPSYTDALNALTEVREKVRALPSVIPHYTDAEIQKMQEMEQAEIQKAYELGKAEHPKTGHWIGQKKIGFGEWKEFIVPLKDGYVTGSCSCSECGEWLTGSDEYLCSGNYCPSCGCRMEGSE